MSLLDRRRVLGHGVALVAGVGIGAGLIRWTWPIESQAGTDTAATTPEEQLRKLGLVLPEVSASKTAVLVPAVRVGETLYVSGHTPMKDGKPMTGKVGKELNVEEAKAAARQVALTILAVVCRELGSLDRVVRVVKTLGMVNCTPEFTQQPAVINGFSELLVQVFGEKAGKGARSAVGVAGLPGGVAVEIECIFQVKT